MTNYKFQRGEIYMADLGTRVGSVQGGTRPVVIISNPLNNKYSPTVNVLPLTTRTKNNLPVHVTVGLESGLTHESTILAEQVLTLDKSKLIKLVGTCPQEIMNKVTKAIMIQMSITNELQAV